MGHDDSDTTAIYAHYAPSPHEVELVQRAFERAPASLPLRAAA